MDAAPTIDVFLWHDGPQVFAVRTEQRPPIVAYLLEKRDGEPVYALCRTTEPAVDLFATGRISLRRLLLDHTDGCLERAVLAGGPAGPGASASQASGLKVLSVRPEPQSDATLPDESVRMPRSDASSGKLVATDKGWPIGAVASGASAGWHVRSR